MRGRLDKFLSSGIVPSRTFLHRISLLKRPLRIPLPLLRGRPLWRSCSPRRRGGCPGWAGGGSARRLALAAKRGEGRRPSAPARLSGEGMEKRREEAARRGCSGEAEAQRARRYGPPELQPEQARVDQRKKARPLLRRRAGEPRCGAVERALSLSASEGRRRFASDFRHNMSSNRMFSFLCSCERTNPFLWNRYCVFLRSQTLDDVSKTIGIDSYVFPLIFP